MASGSKTEHYLLTLNWRKQRLALVIPEYPIPGVHPIRDRKSGLKGKEKWIADYTQHSIRAGVYWITRSARFKTSAGTVMPNALAVFKLTISSYRFTFSTGNSPGLAPLRILSM